MDTGGVQRQELRGIVTVLARTAPGTSPAELAKRASDFNWAAPRLASIEQTQRKGLYDISPYVLGLPCRERNSVVEALIEEAVQVPFALPVLVDGEYRALKTIAAGDEVALEASVPDQRDAAGFVLVSALNAIRRSGNKAVLPWLFAEAAHIQPSCGTAPADVLQDIAGAVGGLEIRADSKVFVIVDAVTASRLALKNSGGVLAFPNLSAAGGELTAYVRAIVVDVEEMRAAGGDDVCAVVVDAAGLLMNPGSVLLARSDDVDGEPPEPAGGAGEVREEEAATAVALKALRTVGIQRRRACVAVIKGKQW